MNERLFELLGSERVPDKYRAQRMRLYEQSLAGARLPFLKQAGKVTDLGTGYGYPGLVLACALPGTEFSLVDILPERLEFLRYAVEELGLGNVVVVGQAVETWDGRGMDVVTAKNVATTSTTLEWAAPLLRVGGHAVVWMTRWADEDRADGLAAAAMLGLEFRDKKLTIGESKGTGRMMIIFEKTRETPPKFPRGRRAALHVPITVHGILPRDRLPKGKKATG